ncbi:MAG TPA: hypothetical protein VGX96_06220, partial [Candidatus Elarobacter sp.]|nr:hypothetical protein [Candidatus Elarobacter sp.]
SQIFSNAAATLAEVTPYFYSICEMGFLRMFCEDGRFAAQAQILKESSRFQIVGGGITSPDNVITHPEAFIRNYLSGWQFVERTFPALPKLHAWIPDDFGHDSQLPALLSAMGMQSASFQRVPSGTPVDGTPSVFKQLQQSGVDFVWTAADGSAVIAHWLMGGYGQGDTVFNQNYDRNKQHAQPPVDWIDGYLTTDGGATQTTPYLFLPVGSDFRIPQLLTTAAKDWNDQQFSTGKSPVYAVCAAYDDFVQLVDAHASELPVQPMYATPFWTGCYAMRPAIKRSHNDSTRALLAAEAFDQLLPGAGHAAAIASAWNDLAPTTHHDFIPGSASVPVYRDEQLPLLATLATTVEAVLGNVLDAVAANAGASPQPGEMPFVVFNPLGLTTRQLVEVPASFAPFDRFESVRAGDAYLPIQISATGTLLFIDTLPSIGYAVMYLSPQQPTVTIPPVSVTEGSGTFTLRNESVAATIDEAELWNLTSVNDLAGDPAANVLGGPANAIVIYMDTGDSYSFGCEGGTGSNFQPAGLTGAAGAASIVENGPLRCSVTTTVTFTANAQSYAYQRTYALIAGEPLLRMSLTGTAPKISDVSPGSAVVVEFPLASTIATVGQGTTSHWTAEPQVFYWAGAPSFQPTRDFAIAYGQNAPLGAIYHGSIPAWGLGAYGGTNVFAGCLIRNTRQSYNDDLHPDAVYAWGGTDPEPHVLEYAFRVPSGIADPSTGQVLAEARGYASSCYVREAGAGGLPEAQSLASVQSNAGIAVVAALKAGSFDPSATFVRVYDPSNVRGNPIVLDLDGFVAAQGGGAFTVQIVTALEQPIDGEQPWPYSSSSFTFVSRGAFTTLKIAPA